MATYTEHHQPYGPLARREIVVDGDRFVLRRSDIRIRPGEIQYFALREPEPTEALAEVFVREQQTTVKTMDAAEAELRLALVRRLPAIEVLLDNEFEVRVRLTGGILAREWIPRAGCDAWCEITFTKRALAGEVVPVTCFGEVWPAAWPEIFGPLSPRATQCALTTRGRALLEGAMSVAEVPADHPERRRESVMRAAAAVGPCEAALRALVGDLTDSDRLDAAEVVLTSMEEGGDA